MLPRDQGERGDEENHWQIWSDREAAGEYELLRFAFLFIRGVEVLCVLLLY